MTTYTRIKKLGEGAFGQVFKARERETGRIVALKYLKKDCPDWQVIDQQREIAILSKLKHPNIVQYHSSFETHDHVVVVMEYAGGSNLQQLLDANRRFSEDKVRDIARQLVSAMQYLHSKGIVHRDLKTANVVLRSDGSVKLCDFGFAKVITVAAWMLTSQKGTPLYLSPERVMGKPYDHAADLWALGCLVYEIHTGKPPFMSTSHSQLKHRILKGSVEWPYYMAPNCKDFLQGLLTKDPEKRLTWPLLEIHPFLANSLNAKSEVSYKTRYQYRDEGTELSYTTLKTPQKEVPIKKDQEQPGKAPPRPEDKHVIPIFRTETETVHGHMGEKVVAKRDDARMKVRAPQIEVSEIRGARKTDREELAVELVPERKPNTRLNSKPERMRGSHQEHINLQAAQQEVETLQLRLRKETQDHQDSKIKLRSLIRTLRAEKEDLQKAITAQQKDATRKERDLMLQMEEMKKVNKVRTDKLAAELQSERQRTAALDEKLVRIQASNQRRTRTGQATQHLVEDLKLKLQEATKAHEESKKRHNDLVCKLQTRKEELHKEMRALEENAAVKEQGLRKEIVALQKTAAEYQVEKREKDALNEKFEKAMASQQEITVKWRAALQEAETLRIKHLEEMRSQAERIREDTLQKMKDGGYIPKREVLQKETSLLREMLAIRNCLKEEVERNVCLEDKLKKMQDSHVIASKTHHSSQETIDKLRRILQKEKEDHEQSRRKYASLVESLKSKQNAYHEEKARALQKDGAVKRRCPQRETKTSQRNTKSTCKALPATSKPKERRWVP